MRKEHRDKLREAVLAHNAKRRAAGKVVGAPPYGYQADAGGNLFQNPKEQFVLASIKRMRGNGVTWDNVAMDLNRRGYRTRAGTPWTKQALWQNWKRYLRDSVEGDV